MTQQFHSASDLVAHYAAVSRRLCPRAAPFVLRIAAPAPATPRRPRPTLEKGTRAALREINALPWPVRGKTLFRIVCRSFDIPRATMLAAGKRRHVVEPRQIGMALARGYTRLSYPSIARLFGRSDHSTSHHAVRKFTPFVEAMLREVAQ